MKDRIICLSSPLSSPKMSSSFSGSVTENEEAHSLLFFTKLYIALIIYPFHRVKSYYSQGFHITSYSCLGYFPLFQAFPTLQRKPQPFYKCL